MLHVPQVSEKFQSLPVIPTSRSRNSTSRLNLFHSFAKQFHSGPASSKEPLSNNFDVTIRNVQGTWEEISSTLFHTLESTYSISEELESFCEENKRFVEQLHAGTTWIELKKKEKEGFISRKELEDWDAFRQRAKGAIEIAVSQVMRNMGFSTPVIWKAIGTNDPNSDIDNVAREATFDEQENLVVSDKKDEKAVTTAKIIFDALWRHVFGGLSGDQVDLETYQTQGGERDIYEKLLSIAPDFLPQYAEVGFLATHTQIYRYFSQEEWETYTQTVLDTLSKDKKTRKSLQKTFQRIASFVQNTDTDIRTEVLVCREAERLSESLSLPIQKVFRQAQEYVAGLRNLDLSIVDPESTEYKEASFSYKISRVFKIGERMASIDEKLKLAEEKLSHTKTAILRKRIQHKIGELLVEQALNGYIRECFFPEGYLAPGSYNSVCKRGGGQAEAREKERVLRDVRNQSQEVSIPITAPRLGDPSRTYELFESILENVGMYKHKLQAYDCPEEQAFKASKYSERITDACLQMFEREIENILDKTNSLSRELLCRSLYSSLKKEKRDPLEKEFHSNVIEQVKSGKSLSRRDIRVLTNFYYRHFFSLESERKLIALTVEMNTQAKELLVGMRGKRIALEDFGNRINRELSHELQDNEEIGDLLIEEIDSWFPKKGKFLGEKDKNILSELLISTMRQYPGVDKESIPDFVESQILGDAETVGDLRRNIRIALPSFDLDEAWKEARSLYMRLSEASPFYDDVQYDEILPENLIGFFTSKMVKGNFMAYTVEDGDQDKLPLMRPLRRKSFALLQALFGMRIRDEEVANAIQEAFTDISKRHIHRISTAMLSKHNIMSSPSEKDTVFTRVRRSMSVGNMGWLRRSFSYSNSRVFPTTSPRYSQRRSGMHGAQMIKENTGMIFENLMKIASGITPFAFNHGLYPKPHAGNLGPYEHFHALTDNHNSSARRSVGSVFSKAMHDRQSSSLRRGLSL